VLRGLLAELDLTMTLSGFTRTAEIDRSVLRLL
jgi:isopentenyl diphosphate isomerase/L-lactate dehydrogenase-like FMN-dependent dehydrogenase